MKTRFINTLKEYVRISASLLPVLFLIRILEYFQLSALHNLPPGSWKFIASGIVPDLFVYLSICLAFLLPFILISMLSLKAASWTFTSLATVWFLVHFALIRYFATTLVPLDQVVFSYTVKEMMVITASSAEFSLLSLLPFAAIVVTVLAGRWLCRNLDLVMPVLIVALALMIAGPFLLKGFNPLPSRYQRDTEYFMVVNKPWYLIQKCRHFLASGGRDNQVQCDADAAMQEQIRLYQEYHPEFSFIGPTYPLLHKEQTPDVLSPFFNTAPNPPNLVFIIVESLSSAFCGPSPWLGSYTPFLDSLARHSLTWENCLSASERTFYVLPALFGSLPYGDGRYLDRLTRASYHLSLIRYLDRNGYTTRFFYGGDPSFNQMDLFLKRNNIGYILNSWGNGFQRQEKNTGGFTWGYPDADLFKRSMQVKDSMNSSPFLDIYLTLSMHAPFVPPDEQHYRDLTRQYIEGSALSAEEKKDARKYLDIYSTILYTDNSIRQFFAEYSKRPEYANTIFFITGDHSLPELYIGWHSPWERFRVPFIVYSPLLKAPHRFQSVVTHYDVTPSILAMLREGYGIESAPLSHWLGVGLDTASDFTSDRSIVFIRNNKEMVDFVDSNLCLYEDRLTRIRSDLTAEPVNDEAVRDRLKAKLDNFVAVTGYTGRENCLIPIWMMFGQQLNSYPVTIEEPITLDAIPTTDEYITILKKMVLNDDYSYLYCDFTFNIRADEKDPGRLPELAFEIQDQWGNQLGYDAFPVVDGRSYRPGMTGKGVFRKNIDLSYIRKVPGCTLKMYLWNKYRNMFSCDSLNGRINGFK